MAPRVLPLQILALLVITSFSAVSVRADCGMSPLGGVQEGNVVWGLKDSVSACPAGDSVVAGHPCRLRITLHYFDSNCNPKGGVPPESVWVTYTQNGAVVNDEGTNIFADDSTDASGAARITIPSFSGYGTVTVRLYVAGVSQGTHTAHVRTTDSNADGRCDDNDDCVGCYTDINYSGSVTGADYSLFLDHCNPRHWHRNTLFGTLVRRTNVCTYCTGGHYNTLGGDYCWSINGKMLAASIYDTTAAGTHDCTINLIPADPSVGNVPTRFTNPPPTYHDYSPSWSPLGTAIYWVRRDSVIMYKGIWGHNTDTTTYTLSLSGLPSQTYNSMEDLSISPDGNTLAFHYAARNGRLRLYTAPAVGGAVTQVTQDTTADDAFPEWSPDGATIIFHRFVGTTRVIYEVPAAGGTSTPYAPAGYGHEASFHPDGSVIVYSEGGTSVQTATVDASITEGASPVVNYPAYTTTLPLPKLSPDGTRLAIRSYPPWSPTENMQLWAVRRNMSLPPQLTAFVGQSLADTTVAISVYVVQGANFSGAVSATDPESDALTFGTAYLRTDLGMTFNTGTHEFSWTPPANTVGQTFNVKFSVTTPSGGSDSFIAQFTVHQTAPQFGSHHVGRTGIRVVSANPVRGHFDLAGDFSATGVRLEVYDVNGRRVVALKKTSGNALSWDLRQSGGEQLAGGVYFYRAIAGGESIHGKFVILQ